MQYPSLTSFLTTQAALLRKGPIALLFIEDEVELDSTLRHHLARGFGAVIAVARPGTALPEGLEDQVHLVEIDMTQDAPLPATVNAFIDAAPGTWFYYGYNAEYLFHPFCETRSVGEMVTFCTEERRDTVLCFVVDAYARDLDQVPSAVSIDTAQIDRAGYYALERKDADGHSMDRQMDFYGGLRWRFEEHIPLARRRIDRPALFRARPGLRLDANHRFNVEEYNTFQCAWHHSITAAVVSFRTAKALKRNPGSTFDIRSFTWLNSRAFTWRSEQLLEIGLMEPGQWF